MSGVLVTAEVERQVVETPSGTVIVETPLIGPEGPPGSGGGGEGATKTEVAGKLAKAANLSDLVDAVAARTNLGLGSAAIHAHSDYDLAGAAAAAQAASQPLDSDLTAIAALSTTPFGRGLLELATAAAGRTALGLGSAATQPSGAFDAAGAAASAQAASQPLDSDLTAIAALSTTEYGRAFLALTSAAAGRTALGLGTAAVEPATAFQPSDSDLTAIAALATSAFGRSLLELASAAKAREALELGSAAQQASGAFDPAGAAAAAQAASQPLDSDLTAIAALSTSAFGRELLTKATALAVREAIETNSFSQYELSLRNGLPEKQWWGISAPYALGSPSATEKVALFSRFIPHRNMTVRGLSIVVTTAATANDEVAVCMKAENGTTTLAESGAVAGKLNVAGRQDIDFTADVNLTAGTIYHPGVQYGTKLGTIAQLAIFNILGNQIGMMLDPAGAPTSPNRIVAQNTPTFPFATSPVLAASTSAFLTIVRER